MSDDSQPTKRPRHIDSSNDTQLEEAEPIGAQSSTKSAIPIGEEAKLDVTSSSEDFLSSDARKTIDDNLTLITRDLPKFSRLHNVTSVDIMKTVDAIQIPLVRAQAFQHIRKTLTEALPLLEASAIKLATDITQTKLAVSTAKLAIDEHSSNARSAAASAAAGGSASEDADLAEGLPASEDVRATLKATHKSGVTKLTALTTRHTTILSELSLWKGTLQEVKRRIEKRKKKYNKNKKRANLGAPMGFTEMDLTDVNEWVISSSSRTLLLLYKNLFQGVSTGSKLPITTPLLAGHLRQ